MVVGEELSRLCHGQQHLFLLQQGRRLLQACDGLLDAPLAAVLLGQPLQELGAREVLDDGQRGRHRCMHRQMHRLLVLPFPSPLRHRAAEPHRHGGMPELRGLIAEDELRVERACQGGGHDVLPRPTAQMPLQQLLHLLVHLRRRLERQRREEVVHVVLAQHVGGLEGVEEGG